MQDQTVLVQGGQNQEQDLLVLANGYAGQDLDTIVVLDPDQADQLFLPDELDVWASLDDGAGAS